MSDIRTPESWPVLAGLSNIDFEEPPEFLGVDIRTCETWVQCPRFPFVEHTPINEGCFVRICRCAITGEPISDAGLAFTDIPRDDTLEKGCADPAEINPSSEFAHLSWLKHPLERLLRCLHSSAEESEERPLGISS